MVIVKGLKMTGNLNTDGFDYHYLYPEDEDKKTRKKTPRIHPLPYHQSS